MSGDSKYIDIREIHPDYSRVECAYSDCDNTSGIAKQADQCVCFECVLSKPKFGIETLLEYQRYIDPVDERPHRVVRL